MSWTQEDRLLLYCCRREKEELVERKIIEAVKNRLDWGIFLEKARENGVSALLYSRLNEIMQDYPSIPGDIFEGFEEDYYLNATKNTLIFKELGKVLEAFKNSGPEVIVLKGAALAEEVYENIALRPMSDVDLLVKEEDMAHADERLKTLGYGPVDAGVDEVDFSSTYLTTLDYRSREENSPSFHIHWHFVNSTIPNESYIRNIKMENVWRDAENTEIAGVETLVMAPHHLLIHLSEHALRVTHSLSKLSLLCDINEAVNYYQGRLDWSRLIYETYEFNLDKMVYLSLYFSSKFLGTQIPEDVLSELRPKHFSVGEKIFMNAISRNRRLPGLSYFVHLSMNRGVFAKLKFVGRTFFAPRQFIAQRNYIPLSEVKLIHYLRRANEVFSRFFKVLG
ncbi:MAG: hypothetical protein GTO17_05790 [Candidatus Aminicenantes bacterium]|nr:hypothetical protein [Candidatus Aminicenantes bacterium]